MACKLDEEVLRNLIVKRMRIPEERLLFHFNFLGMKVQESSTVLISYVEPETELEREEMFRDYRSARDKYLQLINHIAGEIISLERSIDDFNKQQLLILDSKVKNKVLRLGFWKRLFLKRGVSVEFLNSVLVSKSDLQKLYDRALDLISVLKDEVPHLPMQERQYTILIDVDYFVNYLVEAYGEIKVLLKMIMISRKDHLLHGE